MATKATLVATMNNFQFCLISMAYTPNKQFPQKICNTENAMLVGRDIVIIIKYRYYIMKSTYMLVTNLKQLKWAHSGHVEWLRALYLKSAIKIVNELYFKSPK